MQRRKAAMAATVAGIALTGSLVAGAAPSYADSASSTVTTAAKAPKGDGAKVLCRRVPALERRVNRAVKRLEAGVNTPGSIARLQQRIDNANAKGDTAVAKLLGDRMSTRKALLPNLEQRQTDLKSVGSWCQTQGDASGSAGVGS
ncbi:hypothetical protein ABZ832_16905 [Streptantibioticus parmotrematis]|nr:hypothetical protein [Streptantibioticus parmotrematis]